jgi:CheY-like chemotaxis protein
VVLQEVQRSYHKSYDGAGLDAPVGARGLILTGAVGTIFLAAIIAALPCMAAEDATSILKAQAEMLSNEAKTYTDFLKDIGIALGVVLAFLGLTTWLETRATIKRAVENVRARAEVSAKKQINATLTELFDEYRKNIEERIEKEAKTIEEQLRQLRESVAHVNDISADLVSRTMPAVAPTDQLESTRPKIDPKILWVDDHPENNSYEVEVLKHYGAEIKQVTSTANALREFARGDWNLVVSDMRREENSGAGFDMLKNMRERGQQVSQPEVIFYASQEARNKFAKQAALHGAVFATKPQELFRETHERIGIPSGF